MKVKTKMKRKWIHKWNENEYKNENKFKKDYEIKTIVDSNNLRSSFQKIWKLLM